MSTHKNFDRIGLIAIIAAVILTLLFMNGEALGITKIVDADSESHEDSQYFTEKDLNGSWDSSSAAVITLQGTEASISGNGAYMQDGNLVIVSPGDYVVSGELTDGSIIINSSENAKVRILLNGIHLTCDHDACIRVEEADKVFLTLAEGSDNTLISGETYSDTALEDGTGGVIFAHDDLTINGSGNLQISGGPKHGIDANDSLVLAGGNIQITAPQDGVHVNDHLNICSTVLTVDAQDDGIHADDSIYIESGTVTITNSYEGIEANIVEIAGGEIDITCIDDGINANGESDDVSESTETPLVSITGGRITITNTEGNDADGIDSNGDILIAGGEVYIHLIGTGSNCALDYGSESGGICQINGGIVVAAGGSSMLEAIDSASTQSSFTWINHNGDASSGILTVTDADGKQLLSHEIPVGFTAVTVSCPGLLAGSTYTLSIDDYTEEITLTDTATNLGGAVSPGGFGHRGSRSDNFSSGDFTPGNGGDGDFTPGNGRPGDFSPDNEGPGNFSPDNEGPGNFPPDNEGPGNFDSGNRPQPDTRDNMEQSVL